MQDFDDIDALFISEGLVPSTESCSAVYLDMLKSRDAEIDIYKRRESIFHAALDAYRREINILKASNFLFDTMGEEGESYMSVYFGRSDFRYDFEGDMTKVRGALLCEFPKEELTANPAMSTADKNDFSRE